MIDKVIKIRMETRDWPYVIDFERLIEESGRSEVLTLRTGTAPRGILLKSALKVARAALLYHGLELLTAEHLGTGFALSSVTWSDGDEPGSRVEVFVTSTLQLREEKKREPVTAKINLPKVDREDEFEYVGEGTLREKRHVSGSLKDEYNAALFEFRALAKAYADGESEQGELFSRVPEPAHA